jgi:hypothetical protein
LQISLHPGGNEYAAIRASPLSMNESRALSSLTSWLAVSVGVIVVTLLVSSASIQPRNLELGVTGEISAFEGAVREYQDIWRLEGQRIVDAMERTTGLRFEASPIGVVVYEGLSNSGFRERPMRLRASYSTATERATLVHELAHRLIGELVPASFEDHPIIFLFVYDVWAELWGNPFADEQVGIESKRRGIYDYETAWRNTLEMTATERAARFKQFLIDHPPKAPQDD